MKLRETHFSLSRRRPLWPGAFECGGYAQAFEQTGENGIEIEGQQQAGQMVSQTLQHQGAVEPYAPASRRGHRGAQRAVLRTGRQSEHRGAVPLHGDNGSTLKATTVLAMLHWLGVKPSYSRPRVSDDNAFVESLFKTAKYRPEFPVGGFANLDQARTWAADFAHWYNFEHRHSGIRYVTPAQRHTGRGSGDPGRTPQTYLQARERNPRRWSRKTRDWSHIGVVTLNPKHDTVVNAALHAKNILDLAA